MQRFKHGQFRIGDVVKAAPGKGMSDRSYTVTRISSDPEIDSEFLHFQEMNDGGGWHSWRFIPPNREVMMPPDFTLEELSQAQEIIISCK